MSASGSVIRANGTATRWARWDDGPTQRVNAFWRAIFDADPGLRRRDVHVAVELVIGDAIVRVATGSVRTTSSRSGEVRAFHGALVGDEIEIDQSISLDGQQASARSVSLTIPSALVRPGTLIGRGRILGGIGEVSLVVDGMDHDLRLVLLRGDLLSPSFGADGEAVTVTLTDPRLTDSSFAPSVVADSARWASIGNAAVGARYPVILNGYDKVPCLPVYSVIPNPGKWLVCGGRGFGTPTVYVNGVAVGAGDATYPWSKVETVDAKGEPVVLIDFTSGAATWTENDVVHATITTDPSAGGDAAVSVIGAIRSVLRGFTASGELGLHPDLFADAEGKIPAWNPRVLINGSGDKAARTLEFVESGLLPSFPMLRMAYEGRGIGPIVIDRRRGAVDGSLTARRFPLRERQNYTEETSKESLFNEFEIRYAYDLIANNYTKVSRLDASNSAICALSASDAIVDGIRPMTPYEAPYVSDENVAEGILAWLAAHLAIPSYYVEWSAEPWVFVRHRRGQNVAYTDDQFGFSSACATIERLTFSRRGSIIGLRVWHPFWSGLGLA